jgi:hypothetical protein
MERVTVFGLDDTVTVAVEKAQLTPVKDEVQPTFTLPAKPQLPEISHVRDCTAGLSPGKTGMINASLSQLRTMSGPDTGTTEVHADEGPKQDSLDPLGMTMYEYFLPFARPLSV